MNPKKPHGFNNGENSVTTDSDFHEGDGIVSETDGILTLNNDDFNQDEHEINDADLLRSMLAESENYLADLEAQEAREEKQCWVCFASEEDDTTAVWVHPCRCIGSTKWVHQVCIQRWIDEKQKGNSSAEVECPQCGIAYVIKLPKANTLVALLDASDKIVQRLCPIVAGAVCVGSIYWTCVSYGAVTLMQVLGHERGLTLMVRTDPLLLLVSLPLVPVSLVIGKMNRWEDRVLKCLRDCIPSIPLSRYVLPSFAVVPEREALQASLPPITDPVSVTRLFCGALFFPSIASFLGNTFFYPVASQVKRTLLGGATFIVIKGILKIYHKQHTFLRQCQRVILDHNELPTTATVSRTLAEAQQPNSTR